MHIIAYSEVDIHSAITKSNYHNEECGEKTVDIP